MLGFLFNAIRFLFGWFRSALPFIAGYLGSVGVQLLVATGFSVTLFTGFNFIFSYLIEMVTSNFNSLPSYALQFLGLMWFDKALNLILSTAYFILMIKGMRAGSMARQAWWKPGQVKGSWGA